MDSIILEKKYKLDSPSGLLLQAYKLKQILIKQPFPCLIICTPENFFMDLSP